MRSLIRFFFRTLRAVLGPFMLLGETLTRPKGMVRSAEAQARVDADCARLTLYQYRTCPFCIKVRQEMRRLSLDITQRDAQHSAADRNALEAGGGKVKVPCLKIESDAGSEWLYESDKIIARLQQRFTSA